MNRSFKEVVNRFRYPIKGPAIKYRVIGFFVMSNWFAIDLMTIVFTNKIGNLIQDGNFGALNYWIVLYCILFVLSYVIKYFTRFYGAIRNRYEVSQILWKDIYRKFFKLDISMSEKIGTGRLINILDKGIQNRIDAHFTLHYAISKSIWRLIIIGYLLVKLGRIYVAIFIFLIGLVSYFSNIIFKFKLQPLRRDRKAIGVSNSRQMVRMIMSKVEILQNNNQNTEIKKYDQGVRNQKKIHIYTESKRVYLMFNLPLIIAHSFFPLIIVYVIRSNQNGTFSYGLFSALILAGGSLGQFMLELTDHYKKILDNYIHIEKLRDLFDKTPNMEGYNEGDEYEYRDGNIELKDITFSYDETNVLSDLSISIKGGKKTALVGVSGSGKSTLVKLIAGYLRPDKGSIIVDGQDLTGVSLKSYYKHIGYLTQEPSVFDGTIIDNLTYAIDGELDNKKLDECIKLAKCEFIYDFPKGVETEIGERGIRLSGGQRQRLAIAKIFLKNPEIIILDEPTSALDSFSEEAITEAMHNLFEKRTVIIIAHRLQTVKNAEDIIVLDKGRVIERGSHIELVSTGGSYAKMLELQSGF